MQIILSAFGDTLRSRPMEVQSGTTRQYVVVPLEPPYSREEDPSKYVLLRKAVFTWRGKVEAREGGRWPSEDIRIFELELD